MTASGAGARRGAALVLAAAALLSCQWAEQPPARPPSVARDAREGSGSSAKPGAADSAAADHDLSAPILWLEEQPGYVSVEVRNRYLRWRYRFVLYADGTVRYCDDSFHGYRVSLTPEERDALFDRVAACGFFEVERLFDEGDELLLLDAGTVVIGARRGDDAHTLSLLGPVQYWRREQPENERLAAFACVQELLAGYSHPRAVAEPAPR